jgi:hypothetical protein
LGMDTAKGERKRRGLPGSRGNLPGEPVFTHPEAGRTHSAERVGDDGSSEVTARGLCHCRGCGRGRAPGSSLARSEENRERAPSPDPAKAGLGVAGPEASERKERRYRPQQGRVCPAEFFNNPSRRPTGRGRSTKRYLIWASFRWAICAWLLCG